MGLDNYAVLPEPIIIDEDHPDYIEGDNIRYEQAPDEPFEDIKLTWGLFSPGGSSFRGKVYSKIVHVITGVSLFEDYIPPDKVAEMADALEANVDKIASYLTGKHMDHARNLVQWFKVCKENGYGIISWY